MIRVALVLTGGTIGSELRDGYISPVSGENLAAYLPEDCETEIFRPYNTLSEQLNGEFITRLVNYVGSIKDGFDGVIVAHGTDTLQYSAAALALAFGKSKTPIVLASSNYILSDSRSNGRDNLYYAAEFIREGIGGVFVSYRNAGEAPKIHPASRLLAHSTYSDAVSSLGGEFGYFDNGFIRSVSDFNADNLNAFTLGNNPTVLWLRAHPDMALPSAAGFGAVLLEGYHSGTLPTAREDFRDFCKSCSCPVYLVGMPSGSRYESTAVYNELGIEVLDEITPIYAYIKLRVVVENKLNHNILFE